MAFDTPTRNKLQKMVAACRDLLTEEFEDQLQERYGIYPADGRVLEMDRLPVRDDETLAVAGILRARIEHLMAGDSASLTDAVRRVLREQAFTVLNRFAAVRMAEERGLIPESVAGGITSKGAQVFADLAGPGLGGAYDRYRIYLDRLFDELALDLRVLFDRFSSLGLLFPGESALTACLELLNAPALQPLWAEDETIGWIYQYYNDPEERKKMRKESAAPRNSRELAVRNQFFTPRYVVEFLTDNTLGRIWYEMSGGATTLKDQCRYLVRRPTEIFLAEGETVPETPDQEGLSQEELLRQPVHIPHRPLKDPRELRLLDPACGSMHFGLYAFDLFETIYEEAWDTVCCPALHAAYAGKDEFLKDVPRLIIEHNIHGIDIDPRAVQIAGLSLWLRAQKAWQIQGVKPADRPQVRRSNIVCAEPMPGSPEMLEDFVATLNPPLLGELVRTVFDKMQLAGEAGSLLKIEEEIRADIDSARAAWEKIGAGSRDLFSIEDLNQTLRPGTQQELTGIERALTSDLRPLAADFWETAEQRVIDALRAYAERADIDSYQRRLFADDAARGFAFIDLCRQRYDVAVMNPPFGDASLLSKPYIEDIYGDTKGDVYKAFVECFHARLIPAGYLGIISSRTGFFLGQSEDWRTRVVLRLFRPIALADLGSGVLDAMVEVAAYVLRNLSVSEARDLTHSIVPALGKVVRDKQDRFSLPKWQAVHGGLKRHQAVSELEHLEAQGFVQRSPGEAVRYTPIWHSVNKVTAPPEPDYPPLLCIRALAEDDKGTLLADAIRGAAQVNTFVCDPGEFTRLPSTTFAYWVGTKILSLFNSLPSLQSEDREAVFGGSSKDDFRYLRLSWEVSCGTVARSRKETTAGRIWVSFAKGGTFAHYYSDLHLAIQWANDGREIKASISEYRGSRGWGYQWTAALNGHSHYFRGGLTWPRRTNGLSFRALPSGCIFGDKGPAVFVEGDNTDRLLAINAVVSSRPFSGLVALQLARVELAQSFEVGLIQRTPFPPFSGKIGQQLADSSHQAWIGSREKDTSVSTSHAFLLTALLAAPGCTLAERAAAWATRVRMSEATVAAIQSEIDDLAFRLYGLDAADRAALTSTLATEATTEEDDAVEDDELETATFDVSALAADLLAYALSCAFGRWDIRYATGERLAPPAPDPFDPLPVCPPGMLQNAEGLPAEPKDVPADYPLRISWSGILVDDENHLKNDGQSDDIVARVQNALKVIWKDRWEAIEQEVCEILGVKTLRDYFRRPAAFFADHLKRYSKSRRRAPIYWPLSTKSGSYTLWLYYHRLTDQTLFQCVNAFVKPKIEEVEADLGRLRNEEAPRDQIDKQVEFLAELGDLRDELLRVAALPWKPNLNDGVLITASPLWSLFQLPKWQKDLKECWGKLEKSDFDWAHLAYTIWPDRVEKFCERDRSIAIAHDLEHLCKVEPPKSKGKRSKKTPEPMPLEDI